MRSTLLMVTTALLALALTACGGGETSGDATGTTDSAAGGDANVAAADADAAEATGDAAQPDDGAGALADATDHDGQAQDDAPSADAPAGVWLRAFGGPGRELFETLWPTQDGGAWLVGQTESAGAGGRDALLVRVDGCGAILGAWAFGGPGQDEGRALTELSSGDLLWVGITLSFEHGNEAWINRMKPDGALLWSRVVGGPGWDTATAVTATADDGAVALGETYNFGPGTPEKHNALLVRVAGDGTMVWERTYGGGKDGDAAFALAYRASDDGLWVGGAAESYGQGHDDAWLLSLDAKGDLLWSRTYGGVEDDEARAMRIDADGSIWLAGFTRGFGASKSDAFVLHVAADGALLGMNRYGTPGNERGYALVARPDGGQTLLGVTDRWDGADDGFALALDKAGEPLWQRRIGGEKVDEASYAAPARGAAAAGTLLWAGFTDSYGKGGREAFAGRLLPDGTGGCKVRDPEQPPWKRSGVTPIAADALPTATPGAAIRVATPTITPLTASSVVGPTSMCPAMTCP